MKFKIDIVHGPNLNLLGKRQPEVYGNVSFEEFIEELRIKHAFTEINYFQSNVEGELINFLQESTADGIIINAGGYAHSSVALADAVASIDTPVVNVHISNIYSREKERHQELLAQYCIGGIYGLGLDSYNFACNYLTNKLIK